MSTHGTLSLLGTLLSGTRKDLTCSQMSSIVKAAIAMELPVGYESSGGTDDAASPAKLAGGIENLEASPR